MPYAAVMLGVKLVFPGPHLHADDLLDLMQLEPPTMSLGVPTIWLSVIQAYERGLAEQPGRWKLPPGMRSLVGGAAVPESLIRAFDKHGVWLLQGWGMTETSPLATVSYPRAELEGASADERYRRAAMAGVPVPLVRLRIRTNPDDGGGRAAGTARRRARSRCAGPSSPARTTACRPPRTSSPPTAGCAPATSRRSTSWPSCASPTAPRT